MILQTTNGYPEILLLARCNVDLFYKTADWLEEKMNISFLKKPMDSNNIVWEFPFEGAVMVLRYNPLGGIAFCPGDFGQSKGHIALKKLAESLGNY
ncbi:hypothetical protein A3860_34735 [Niastella vici]|uniref:DUF302 domain-containing protein n=1 Tax=Niastella vici TaxID=1703345 RepID=A0A1V9FP21_9BACT|nr:hypothetical protein [Niastella vici]OQP60088.1 hypothetical protein A3860_34735 [Niastella vici]